MLDRDRIYTWLSAGSAWAHNIPRTVFERSLKHSLCFGAYLPGGQVGFARVISDFATFANLVDVFVDPAFRGQGISKALLQEVFAHPDLQGLRRFTLATADAHSLYARFGFATPTRPETLMERYDPDIYRK